MTEFQLDIWSKLHCKVIISYYTDSRTCSNEAGETAYSIRGVEPSYRLKAHPTAHAVSHLTHLARENVTTDVTHVGRVCSYRPRPPTVSARFQLVSTTCLEQSTRTVYFSANIKNTVVQRCL